MRKGQKMSEAQKERLSASRKVYLLDPESRAKCGNARRGVKLSKEARDKLSSARKGVKLSEATRDKMSASQKTRMSKPEEKAKVSASHKRKINSAETKAKMSESIRSAYREGGRKVPKNAGTGKKTEYRGMVFRSTYEAATAKKLDEQGKAWMYEPTKFKLSSGRTYTPDFYLPETNEWIEVKGWWRPGSKEKFELFQADYPKERITIYSSKEIF